MEAIKAIRSGEDGDQIPAALFRALTRLSMLSRNCSSVMDGSRVLCQRAQGFSPQSAQVAKRCLPAQQA